MVLAQVSSKNRGWVGGLKVMLPQVTSHGLKSSLIQVLHGGFVHPRAILNLPKFELFLKKMNGFWTIWVIFVNFELFL